MPRVAVDGTFGPSTTASVMAAQRLLGLTADGIVGETSWNAIVKGEEPGTSVPPPRPFPGTLRQGSVGENVRILQIYLNRLAATHPTVPRVAEDGVFGPATRASVVAAQRALGLTPDGVVGPITWNAVVR
ncbi:MAG: peptidoglycan-binding protein [Oscillospiraceae bacterium]|nr:peptidoglycan-binding protein [Oscillospiraceae bacterium]